MNSDRGFFAFGFEATPRRGARFANGKTGE
jgi:hypothetical protein